MSTTYHDRWIECTADAVRIRGYYFPWGTKTIPYASIRGVRRVRMGMLSGRSRVWGTGNPRYWASLDPSRLSKSEGIVIDTGAFVHPFITPDDVAAVEAAIRENGGPAADADGSAGSADADGSAGSGGAKGPLL